MRCTWSTEKSFMFFLAIGLMKNAVSLASCTEANLASGTIKIDKVASVSMRYVPGQGEIAEIKGFSGMVFGVVKNHPLSVQFQRVQECSDSSINAMRYCRNGNRCFQLALMAKSGGYPMYFRQSGGTSGFTVISRPGNTSVSPPVAGSCELIVQENDPAQSGHGDETPPAQPAYVTIGPEECEVRQ